MKIAILIYIVLAMMLVAVKSVLADTTPPPQSYIIHTQPLSPAGKPPVHKKKRKKKVVKNTTPVPPKVLHLSPTPRQVPRAHSIQFPAPPEDPAFRHKKVRTDEAKAFGADLGLGYYEAMGDTPNPGVLVTPDVIYQFTPRYSVAAEMDYRTALNPDPAKLGYEWQDLDLTFTDSNIFTNRGKDFNVSYDVNGYVPTSKTSQDESMILGGSFTLGLTEKIAPFKFKLDNEFYAYGYQYLTAANGTDYNSPFSVMNRFSIAWELVKNLKWNNSFGYITLQTYDGGTNNLYIGSSGLSYLLGDVSFNFAYKYKNGELNDLTLLEGDNYTLNLGVAFHF